MKRLPFCQQNTPMSDNTKERHEEHQQMLQNHRERKELARERHHPKTGKPWHKIKTPPITLI